MLLPSTLLAIIIYKSSMSSVHNLMLMDKSVYESIYNNETIWKKLYERDYNIYKNFKHNNSWIDRYKRDRVIDWLLLQSSRKLEEFVEQSILNVLQKINNPFQKYCLKLLLRSATYIRISNPTSLISVETIVQSGKRKIDSLTHQLKHYIAVNPSAMHKLQQANIDPIFVHHISKDIRVLDSQTKKWKSIKDGDELILYTMILYNYKTNIPNYPFKGTYQDQVLRITNYSTTQKPISTEKCMTYGNGGVDDVIKHYLKSFNIIPTIEMKSLTLCHILAHSLFLTIRLSFAAPF